MSEIIIKQNGFVTGNALLEPIGYAGEMNSRILSITHPTFENCHYILIIIKNDYPYRIGITNGEVLLPPSLLNTATTLNCQFVVVRNNETIDINSNLCDCQFSSSDNCSKMIWKSDMFKLHVKQGLNLSSLNPVPPYEQLVDIYNNISKAQLSVEKAKMENNQILETVKQKIDELQRLSTENNNKEPSNPSEPSQPDTPSGGCEHDYDNEFPLVQF